MKKQMFIVMLLFGIKLGAAVPYPGLSIKRCDTQYTIDITDIENQFSSFTPKRTLDDYLRFMIMIKQKEDLSFKITPLERSLTADKLAIVRTPMQHYNECRTSISTNLGYGIMQFSPPKEVLSTCDKTYAIEAQDVLNKAPKTDPLDRYEALLLRLKQREDLIFIISDFEKNTPIDVIAKLRSPLKKYINCRDAIIRTSTPQQ